MDKKKILYLFFTLCMVGGNEGFAATVTWDGSTDMNWTQPDSTSWSTATYTNGDDASFLGSGAGTVAITAGGVTPGSVTVNSASDYTFSGGTITAASGLLKQGASVLTLGNAGFNGNVTVEARTSGSGNRGLTISSAAAVPTGTLRCNVPATATGPIYLYFSFTGTTFTKNIDIEQLNNQYTILQFGNNNIWSGTVTVSRCGTPALRIDNNGTGTVNPNIVWGAGPFSSKAVTFLADGSSPGSTFGGSGDLGADVLTCRIDSGSKVLRLASTNWSFGKVTLQSSATANKVIMDVPDFFHGKPVEFYATVTTREMALDLNGNSQDIAGLALISALSGASVTNSSATAAMLTLSGSGTYAFTNTTYAGRIAGNLALVKTGSGTQWLGGANSYSGGTTVSNGTLALCMAGTLGATNGAVTVAGATALLNLGGLTRTNGAVTLTDGVISNGTLNGSAFTASVGSVYAVLADGPGGAAALLKTGPGTVSMASASTYTGDTTINNGTLKLIGSVASGVTVDSGGTLSGTGSVSAALTVKSGGTLAIGSPGSAVGTMNVTGDVTLQSGGTNDVTASGAQCDLLAVAGAVQLGGILSAAISVAGTYTNMTAIGGFSGGFAVVTNTLPGLALSVVTNATVLQLVASSPATEADGVWALDQDGDWSNTARWQSGTIASGTNKTADFSQVDITAVRTVTLDSDRTLGRLLFGDTSGADTWTLIANPSSKTLTLDAGGGTPVISNSVTTTIGALLAGTSGFAKQGAGTLIISNNNTGLSGAIAVDGGTLQVDGIGAQGSGAVTVNGGAVLSGTGAMSAAGTALTVKSGGTLAIGSPAGAVGTMNVSGNVALEAGATNAVTVSGSACDLLAVAGSAQLGGTLITAISSAGTRSIMTASGGFSGSFAVVTNTVAGVTLSATIVNATNLQLTAVYTDADGVWTNNGSGNWSDANNWQNGTMASGTNRIADFSQIDITSNRTVTQDASSVTVGTLKFADTAASHDWIVTNNAIALAVGSGAPTISVTNCTATIYSRLTGSQGFIKTGGGGTLTLADDNSAVLSGGVTVSNGTMQLNHLGGAGGGTLTIQSSATVSPGPGRLIVNASGTKDVTLDGVDTTSGYSGDMIVSNGISWSGTITFNNYKNTSRSFGITSFGATAIINPTIAWGTNNTVSNIAFTGQGSFSGSGNLGAGSLKVTLTGDNQTNQLTSDAWSFGSVVLYTSGNGTVIKMGVDNFFHGAPVSYIANNTDRGLALDLNGHSQDIGGLTLPNNGTVYGFNNPVVTNSSATVATLTLSGSGTYSFTNGASAGWIAGNLSLVKKGAGTQTLGGINTYTGDTIISNGVLKLVNAGMISNNASIVLGPAGVLDVSLIAGGFNVLSNQALAGAGTVTGNVNLASGGILSPAGTNTAGTLTLSGDAVISDGTRYNWNYDGGQNTSDTVRVSGNLTLPAMASVNVSSSGALQAKRAALFTYGGTCERTDFSGWIINPGYTLLNDTEQQCVYVIPPPQGSVYRIR